MQKPVPPLGFLGFGSLESNIFAVVGYYLKYYFDDSKYLRLIQTLFVSVNHNLYVDEMLDIMTETEVR